MMRRPGWVSARITVALFVCAAAGAVHLPQLQAQADATGDGARIDATLLRTWVGDSVTMVDGLVHVPLSMLASGTTGAYRFELAVFGEDGMQLYRDSWERTVSDRAAAYASVESSTLLESFRFGVRPGHYEVELRAYPTDAADLGVSRRLEVDGFSERPFASDLYIADQMEPLSPDGGGSWSIAHGGFGIGAVARTALLPGDPTLFYYVELYGEPETATSVGVRAAIVDAREHRTVFETPAASVDVGAGGSPYAGNLSLAGLPPGEYELQLSMAESGEELGTVRSAPFRMLEESAGVPSGEDSEEGEYFASLSAEELNDTFGGVGYMVSESERQAYQSLPPDAKRRYLTEFFLRRDPTPDTPGNRFLEEYVDRIATVRMKYAELIGTRERAPWTTDAGRIYLRFGEPDRRETNYFPSGADTQPTGGSGGMRGEVPYEIWAYHSTGFVYLFTQESQFGVWRMIFTSDPNMSSLADWQNRVGSQALQDLASKFGIQPR